MQRFLFVFLVLSTGFSLSVFADDLPVHKKLNTDNFGQDTCFLPPQEKFTPRLGQDLTNFVAANISIEDSVLSKYFTHAYMYKSSFWNYTTTVVKSFNSLAAGDTIFFRFNLNCNRPDFNLSQTYIEGTLEGEYDNNGKKIKIIKIQSIER
jgi:hypothetical protein